MRKSKKKTILLCICGLLLLPVCGFTLYNMAAAYERKADSKEFVDRLIEHADEASADFEDCGLVFSAAEEGDMLIVTDADGWRFCYQTSKKYGDQLVKIEGSMEKEFPLVGKKEKEMCTGNLEIERRNRDCVYVAIEYMQSGLHLHPSKFCSVPEFDDIGIIFLAQADSAWDISQWISNEELAALYKKGKELEEILSAYCELKIHNVDVSIGHYAAP